jgi:hypothetical protein
MLKRVVRTPFGKLRTVYEMEEDGRIFWFLQTELSLAERRKETYTEDA